MAKAERDDGCPRQAEAALAGAAGPEARADLIDWRLPDLERQCRFVDWKETCVLVKDLEGIVDPIADGIDPLEKMRLDLTVVRNALKACVPATMHVAHAAQVLAAPPDRSVEISRLHERLDEFVEQ